MLLLEYPFWTGNIFAIPLGSNLQKPVEMSCSFWFLIKYADPAIGVIYSQKIFSFLMSSGGIADSKEFEVSTFLWLLQ